MTTYSYEVKDSLGHTVSGTLEAENNEEATNLLHQDGYQVLTLEEDDGALLRRRVKKSDVIYATNQLAVMVDTGITLAAALDGIAQQEEHPTLKRVLRDLKSRVEGGEDFSAALARHPKQFNKTFVALVRASEQTGTMGPMLERVAGYLRDELETRSKVRSALAYPGIMLTLAVSVTIFLLTFVMPKFAPLFTRKGIELPTPTVVMMFISQVMVNYWVAWVLGIVATITGLIFWMRTESGRHCTDWLKINLPLLGPVVRKVTISRTVRTLGTLLESGVPVLDALELAAEVSGNIYYRRMWKEVIEEITQGRRIVDAINNTPLLPRTLVQMIGAGEETGRLDHVLAKVSAYYDREVETAIKTATSMIEPALIIFMGLVVGGIGLSLMLPIFQLSRTPGG